MNPLHILLAVAAGIGGLTILHHLVQAVAWATGTWAGRRERRREEADRVAYLLVTVEHHTTELATLRGAIARHEAMLGKRAADSGVSNG